MNALQAMFLTTYIYVICDAAISYLIEFINFGKDILPPFKDVFRKRIFMWNKTEIKTVYNFEYLQN